MKTGILRRVKARATAGRQRTILLYLDQEEKFLAMKEEHNLDMSFGEASRMAFDMFLDTLEEEIKEEQRKLKEVRKEDK